MPSFLHVTFLYVYFHFRNAAHPRETELLSAPCRNLGRCRSNRPSPKPGGAVGLRWIAVRIFNGEAEGGSVDLDEALEITGLAERFRRVSFGGSDDAKGWGG